MSGSRAEDEAATDRIDELRDPSNFEFGTTPQGEKIHIVGTGLPISMLVLGGQEAGEYGDDEQKALCGTVAEFDTDVEVPDGVTDVLDQVCTRCNRQAGYIRNRGKFDEVPL